MADFLNLSGKVFVVTGVANRKSVAWAIASALEAQGAKVLYSVRSEARKASLAALLGDRPAYVCDVEREGSAAGLAAAIAADRPGPIHGLVHSIAFANYAQGFKPFHQTPRGDFLQATAISAQRSGTSAASAPAWWRACMTPSSPRPGFPARARHWTSRTSVRMQAVSRSFLRQGASRSGKFWPWR